MTTPEQYLGYSDIARRYGLANPGVAKNMETRAKLKASGLTTSGTVKKNKNNTEHVDFPEPKVVINSTDTHTIKGFKVSEVDTYMRRRGHNVVSSDQFGPEQDAFGVIPVDIKVGNKDRNEP